MNYEPLNNMKCNLHKHNHKTRLLAQFIPTSPFIDAMVRVTQMNANLVQVWQEILHLFGLFVLFAVLSIVRIKSLVAPASGAKQISWIKFIKLKIN